MALKSRPKKRDWSEARDKLMDEGQCRVCGISDGTLEFVGEIAYRTPLHCAHTIGRGKQDEIVTGPRGGETLVVKRESTVPLCEDCHRQYDERRLDLLPYLTLEEQLDAVRAAGGIESARKRLTGGEG